MPIHETFAKNAPFSIDLSQINWDIVGIGNVLNQLLENAKIDKARGIAESIESTDNQCINVIYQMPNDIAGGIAEKLIQLIETAKAPKSRNELLTSIALVNSVNNFENYLQPIVATNWIAMTHLTKPNSPNQQYYATLEGRLVLGILKEK